MNVKFAFFFIVLSIMLSAACEPISTGSNLPAETAEKSIGDQADPNILSKLPISTRSFEMGTAGYIPRNFPNSSQNDWQDFFESDAASYGGIFGVHVNLNEKLNQEGIPEQVQLAFEQIEGVEPFIALSVSFEDGPFTSEHGELLIREAVAIARKYHPHYISLGVESNTLYQFQQDTFDLYVQSARQAYDKIKAVSPSTLVLNNFQLEYLKGEASLTGQEIESHWHILELFADKMDLVSFTVYPFLEFQNVDEIPDDYLAEIREHTSLPIIITETGWPTGNTSSGVVGSNQAQIEYMMKLIQQANGVDAEVLIWVFPHDAAFGIAGGIFDQISLFRNDGVPKPGYEYWKAINALALK